MLFRSKSANEEYTYLVEKIKRDLFQVLQRKGITVSKIDIKTKAGNLNLSVSIK